MFEIKFMGGSFKKISNSKTYFLLLQSQKYEIQPSIQFQLYNCEFLFPLCISQSTGLVELYQRSERFVNELEFLARPAG